MTATWSVKCRRGINTRHFYLSCRALDKLVPEGEQCFIYSLETYGGLVPLDALGRPRRRWMANIKKYLLGIRLSVVDWIALAQDRYRWRALVNSVMNLQVP
jgi:hypothetical protein